MMDPEHIIEQIHRRDRLGRLFLFLMLIAIIVIQGIAITIGNQTLNRIKLDEQQNTVAMNQQLARIQDQHKLQDDYLLCIIQALNIKKTASTCSAPFQPSDQKVQTPTPAAETPTSHNTTASVQPDSTSTPPAKQPSPAVNVINGVLHQAQKALQLLQSKGV